MAKVITLAQQKGGSGKTTLTAHLAVAFARMGKSVVVIDIDPQGSLGRWAGERATRGHDPAIAVEQVTGWRTQGQVDQLKRKYDIILIDSPPHAETEAKLAVRAADLVVVPLQPSPMDFWATRPTLELAAAEKRPVLLVLNRVDSRAKLADVLCAAAADLGAPIAETRLGSRTAYAAAMLDGRTAMETDPRGRPADEIRALAGEIAIRITG